MPEVRSSAQPTRDTYSPVVDWTPVRVSQPRGPMTRSIRLSAVLLLGALPTLLAAQQGYRQPPAPIADILDAPQTPSVYVSPDRSWLLLAAAASLQLIAELP